METTVYEDALFFDALLREIGDAAYAVDVVTFLFKTSYASRTRAHEIADALKAAAARGVTVRLVLNFSRAEPDVSRENYATALNLASGGCQVRLGPLDRTVHAKVVLLDGSRLFIGSHNLTRGALTYNRELTYCSDSSTLIARAASYFSQVWNTTVPVEQVAPPEPPAPPFVLELANIAGEGAAFRLDFQINHVDGVEAFAAVAGLDRALTGSRMGPTVPPDARSATVVPNAAPGDWVFLAIRAYGEGQVLAASSTVSTVYEPTAPPEEREPEATSPGEGLPPSALIAPTLLTVVAASPTTVTLTWAFVGCTNFDRFVTQQQERSGEWRVLEVVRDASVRSWTGPPLSSDPTLPFRIAVYDGTGASAVSNGKVKG